MAVGDDWQSVNRFAGADLSVMTDFEGWFGEGPTLRLQTTFRCNKQIADTASTFVAKNPRQIGKQVRAVVLAPADEAVRLVRMNRSNDLPEVVGAVLDDIAVQVRTGALRPARSGRLRVDVLGRFDFDQTAVPPPHRIPAELEVQFRTVHESKGLEADVVVLPRLVRGRYGLPSQIEDDPVLELAMTSPDDFPFAEERRLFYVTLTRARSQVVLITEAGSESDFVIELVRDGLVRLTDHDGDDIEVCPRCEKGLLVTRSGPYGPFLACNRYPACTFKPSRTRQTARS